MAEKAGMDTGWGKRLKVLVSICIGIALWKDAHENTDGKYSNTTP